MGGSHTCFMIKPLLKNLMKTEDLSKSLLQEEYAAQFWFSSALLENWKLTLCIDVILFRF
jgi:hypothetical protein